MLTLADIRRAQERLRGVAVHTPLIACPDHLAERRTAAAAAASQLWLKAESFQPIGSFKLRGAYNKIAALDENQRRRGVITYSSGNHGQGVAFAARALGTKAVVVMPHTAPPRKIESTQALGAEVVFVGLSSSERQRRAEELASQHGYVIIPPFDDEYIIAGQGTVGLEIISDLSEVECILAPVGGGGLISGVATAAKLTNPRVKVIGVEPELAADAQASLRTGQIAEISGEQAARTIADGLRTQHVGNLNFQHIRRFVDNVVTVSEAEIRCAVRRLALEAKLLAEPSGAVAPAAYFFHRDQLPPASRTAAVISGGNIEAELLAEILRAGCEL